MSRDLYRIDFMVDRKKEKEVLDLFNEVITEERKGVLLCESRLKKTGLPVIKFNTYVGQKLVDSTVPIFKTLLRSMFRFRDKLKEKDGVYALTAFWLELPAGLEDVCKTYGVKCSVRGHDFLLSL
jgi:hypothetical protein